MKKLIYEILSNKSGEYISPDDIVEKIKQTREFSRHSKEAIKANVINIFKEMKGGEKKEEEKKEDQKENTNQPKLLGKKRQSTPPADELEEFLFKPNIKLSELGGMDEIVHDLLQTIGQPLNHYDLFKTINVEPVKGILLCGPPGCGKTTLAYAIGGEYDIPFYRITGPQIVSSLSGESELKIRKLFNKVIETAPSILFIDEIESIMGKRENASKDMERRIVAQIMACLDDISSNQLNLAGPVFIIGSTSKPEFIDSSVRRSGRFDKEIHIGFPNELMRKNMLNYICREKKLEENIDFTVLAKNTPGYLAADLQSLVREAGRNSINRIIKDKENEKLHITMNDFDDAIKTIQPTAKREGFTTIPNVTWQEIGGLENIRSELYYDIILPIADPLKLKNVGIERAVGVLLYGPPGCGKTLLAKAVANEAKSNFISIKGPELLNKYVGESEKAVRQLFVRARNSSPCIIFFDELDALCPKRSMDNNAATERVVNQLLTEMDGLEDRKQVFIIAATNRPDIIDPAMLRPGRLDKLHYVPLPNERERLSILKALGSKIKICRDINWEEIAKSKTLEGFSGADLASLVREAQLKCLKRTINSDNPELLIEDIEYAMGKIVPSVSKADKIKYENLQKSLRESRSHID